VKPIRVFIVDDEPAARDALRALLRSDEETIVVGEARNGRQAVAALRAGGIDLVFLDVQMPEVDGFQVVEQLTGCELPAIVFVTAYDQYALRAFDLHAVDYLLKPFSDERFGEAVRHAKQLITRGQSYELAERLTRLLEERARRAGTESRDYLRRLPVHVNDRVVLVPVKEIDWIEADGDYARIHVGKVAYLLREALSRLDDSLDPDQFVRIHRSTIVNLDRIRELRPMFKGDHSVRLHDGTELKLSRHFKEPLEERLGRKL
jgi:two-component system, LytTR family, response regulator